MSKKKQKSNAFTIEKLYQIAKSRGYEDKPLKIEYYCDDDWYDYDNFLHETEILFVDNKAIVTIKNYPNWLE